MFIFAKGVGFSLKFGSRVIFAKMTFWSANTALVTLFVDYLNKQA